MGFTRFRLHNFRNLRDGSVNVDGSEVFLVGQNGQGKSNFLEAVYLVSYGTSFRTNKDEELCTIDRDEMAVAAWTSRADESDVAVYLQDKKKRIEIDEKTIRDRKDLIYNVPCIVFCHGDMGFVSGSPDMQRFFFDQTLTLHDTEYLELLRRYRKTLKLRNISLKEKRHDLLEVYNEHLAETGFRVQESRAKLVDEFSLSFCELYRNVSGVSSSLSIRYRPSWRSARTSSDVLDIIREKDDADRVYGTTTTGPHRDRFVFYHDDTEFMKIASTGQIRLAALALRVAQARFFSLRRRRKPVLLLDDVLLELDATKRLRFFENLPEYDQAFFTFLPNEPFHEYRKNDTIVYTVTDGKIE